MYIIMIFFQLSRDCKNFMTFGHFILTIGQFNIIIPFGK
jgi:hypothetical protein